MRGGTTRILGDWMADTIVSSGATSSGIVLNSSDTMEVLSGGTASSTTVNSGGLETIFAGGSDVSAGILGVQDVFGRASSAVVSSGGSQLVESGGRTDGTFVASIPAATENLTTAQASDLRRVDTTRYRYFFDTQVAAGFCGFASPSLSLLVERLVGIRLPKGDRVSDWKCFLGHTGQYVDLYGDRGQCRRHRDVPPGCGGHARDPGENREDNGYRTRCPRVAQPNAR